MLNMLKRLWCLPVLLLVLTLTPVLAAPGDLEDILDMLDAGVSDASIERFVEKNQLTFHLSAKDIVELKKAGATEDLIEYLQNRDVEIEPGSEQGTATQESDQAPPVDEGGGSYDNSSSDSNVYWSFGVGIGWPYYSAYYSPYYYPYYYPYYPYYPAYPCHYGYNGGYYGSGSGTGVYSYWYNKQGGAPGPRGTTVGGSTSTGLSGRVLQTAPPAASSPVIRQHSAAPSSTTTLSAPRAPSRTLPTGSDRLTTLTKTSAGSKEISPMKSPVSRSGVEPRVNSRVSSSPSSMGSGSGRSGMAPTSGTSSHRVFTAPPSSSPRVTSRIGSVIPRASLGTSGLSSPRHASPVPGMSTSRMGSSRGSAPPAPRSAAPGSSFRGGGGFHGGMPHGGGGFHGGGFHGGGRGGRR